MGTLFILPVKAMLFCWKKLNVHFGYKQPHAQPYFLSLCLSLPLIILLLVQHRTPSEQPLISSPQPPLEEDVIPRYLHRDPGATDVGLRALCPLSPPHSLALSPTHWSLCQHAELIPHSLLRNICTLFLHSCPELWRERISFNLLLWKGEDTTKGYIAQY